RVCLGEGLEQPAHAFRGEADTRVAHGERELGAPVGRRVGRHGDHQLTALDKRFSMTWRNRVTSPRIAVGTSPSNMYAMSRCFSVARALTRSSADSTHSRTSNGWASMSWRRAWILEKSRMSLMIVRSASPDSRIVAT